MKSAGKRKSEKNEETYMTNLTVIAGSFSLPSVETFSVQKFPHRRHSGQFMFACRSFYSKNSTPSAVLFGVSSAQHKLWCSSEYYRDQNGGYCLPKESWEALRSGFDIPRRLLLYRTFTSYSAKDTDAFCLLPLHWFLSLVDFSFERSFLPENKWWALDWTTSTSLSTSTTFQF